MCLLYGLIEFAPLDTVSIGSMLVPRAAVILGGTLIINLIAVLIFYKELKISSFDPALATTVGINSTAMHYLLMTLVAVTTVTSFETIGSILVIAMLIVPAATARLLTDRLWTMLLVSAIVGVVAAVSGHWAAFALPGWLGMGSTRTSGAMATMAGLLFMIAVLIAPRHGLASKAWHRIRLSFHVVAEDVLGLLYRIEESASTPVIEMAPTAVGGISAIAETARRDEIVRTLRVGPLKANLAIATLQIQGMIYVRGPAIGLTPTGRTRAVDLVRSHRLWETYLSQHTPLATDHLHAPAEWLEHVTDPALQKRLDLATGRVTRDPQGKNDPATALRWTGRLVHHEKEYRRMQNPSFICRKHRISVHRLGTSR